MAGDSELNSAKGDSDIRFQPKAWRGIPQKGKRMSQCEPEFLDLFADMMDDEADMPRKGKEEFAGLNRRSARLARGWAQRVRAKGTAPTARKTDPSPSPASGGFGSAPGAGFGDDFGAAGGSGFGDEAPGFGDGFGDPSDTGF